MRVPGEHGGGLGNVRPDVNFEWIRVSACDYQGTCFRLDSKRHGQILSKRKRGSLIANPFIWARR